jgi:polyhydroxyalkanoate synthase
MPGDLLNMCFLLLNPARLVIDKYIGFFENMDNKEFIENFVRMEKWIFDSPDVPGETIRQFIEDCYQKNLLIQSRMEVGGNRVDLKNITMPLLNIYSKFDHLVPPGACDLLTSKVGSRDVEDLCIETGHIGIYVSSKSQKQFTPKIVEWLKQRENAAESESTIDAEAENAGRQTVAEAEPVSGHWPEQGPMTGKTAPESKASPKKKKTLVKTRAAA